MNARISHIILPTIIFMIVGMFIPGFTAIGLWAVQTFLTSMGIECILAWKSIWTLTILLGLLMPVLFFVRLNKLNRNNIVVYVIFFNLLEYIFIQSGLTPLFEDAKSLCYASDGQIGMSMGFTAWFSLPLLLIFGFVLAKKYSAN